MFRFAVPGKEVEVAVGVAVELVETGAGVTVGVVGDLVELGAGVAFVVAGLVVVVAATSPTIEQRLKLGLSSLTVATDVN